MISVCMATYNGEKYIKEQLESILKQLGNEDEIIISDDGSSDNTIEVIKSLSDDRIKIYINEGVHGFTPNYENALRHASGNHIYLSDQDDIWQKNKVETVEQYLKEYDLVIHDCKTVNNSMEIMQQSRFCSFNIKSGFFRHLIKSRYLGCCMAFKRDMLERLMPFPKRYDLLEHDIWIAAVGFLYYRTVLVHDPLILYRRHGDNVSDGGFEKGYSLSNKIVRRLYRVKNLLSRLRKIDRSDI